MNRTIQRTAILAELRNMPGHPTADELYNVLRFKVPQISLGTIYRNLEDMAQRGVIRKLELTGKQKRFDGVTDPHHHLRCRLCGRVVNLRHPFLLKLDRIFDRLLPELGCEGLHMEWTGLCPECRKTEKEGENDGKETDLPLCAVRTGH